ncbi:hypothetical protein JCM8097_007123 [Rhodosporidiobolus ruineniae]
MATSLLPLDELVSPLLSTRLLVLLVAAWALNFVWRYRHGNAIGTNYRPDLWSPPGERFLVGHLPVLLKNKGRFLELWTTWLADCPPGRTISITLPFRRLVNCSNPTALEYIQRGNFDNFVKGQTMYERLATVLGDGIFTVDGATWHQQRKVTSKVFTPTLFRTAVSSSVSDNLVKLSATLDRHAERSDEFSLDDLFFRYTLSAFSDFSFSTDVHALSADGETNEPVPFCSAFDTAQIELERRFTNPFWKLSERWDGTGKVMRDANKTIDQFVYGIIDQREAEGKNSFTKEEKKEAEYTDLLSLYLAVEDEQGAKLSKQHVRDAALNLLLAGRDTTAEALSWCCYHLLKENGVDDWAHMRAEVDKLGEVTYDSYKDFIYLNAVFLEALRLHPSVPRNGREALADDQIPNGPRIEKGDIAFWSDWLMARDPFIWGEDASEFKPARWIDETGELRKESQWRAHMFNGGYRICLGQTLATFEGIACLAALVRDFDLRLAPSFYQHTDFLEEGTPRYRGALTLSMDSPLTVQVARRKTNGQA